MFQITPYTRIISVQVCSIMCNAAVGWYKCQGICGWCKNKARHISITWVAHAPGMPGTFTPLPRISNPDMHHGTYVTHVPWCMSGSLTSGFLWSRWREKYSQHSWRMRNSQFYVFGKRPIVPWPDHNQLLTIHASDLMRRRWIITLSTHILRIITRQIVKLYIDLQKFGITWSTSGMPEYWYPLWNTYCPW